MAIPMGLPHGPYPLTSAGVGSILYSDTPGAYALGEQRADGVFYIDYVGRSDEDVKGRIAQHITEASPQFYFMYCESASAAYLKECWLYHTFKPPKNLVHPAKPRFQNVACPVGLCPL